MSEIAKRLYATDETFREVADLLFGSGADELVSKLSPQEAQRQKRQAQIGLASNVVGIAAGTAALGSAHKDWKEAKKPGAEPGPVTGRLQRYVKTPKGKAKLIAAGAGGALALQGTNLVGDAVANRVLARESKKKVAKGYISKMEPGGADLNLNRGKLSRIAVESARTKAENAVKNTKTQISNKIKKNQTDVVWEGEISKVDEDKRQVFGWASIVEMNGEPVVDLQGDYIDINEIEKSAYEYVIKSRRGGDMHRRNGEEAHHASDMIESFLVTPEKIEKMGLPPTTPIGWWVGYQVNDDEAWELVKSGKRTGFSIHGRGQRTPSVI